ncbi:hypothetical protein [Actinopolymorpha alba]|uniref:hypothetical protein n=1 Tax=Actinopolymorpha alba TaxID=533267 RepID=UPI0003AAEA7C|nr:hypothetical protein [Actinopolymorpha alba]
MAQVKGIGRVLPMAAVALVVLSGCTTGSHPGPPTPSLGGPAGMPPPPSSTPKKVQAKAAPEEAAAFARPVTGDIARFPAQQQCLAQEQNAPWFRSMVAAEQHDSQRTHLFTCADFLGSFNGRNEVFEYASSDNYAAPYNLVTKGADELYLYGGGNAPGTSAPYVARIDPSTLKQVWRTPLNKMPGQWTGPASVVIPANGDVIATYGRQAVRIAAATGQVVAEASLPTGPGDPLNTYFDTTVGGPDGTLFSVSQTRPAGCREQGMDVTLRCKGKRPNSVIVAYNPDTLQALHAIATAPTAARGLALSVIGGKTYLYVNGGSKTVRYLWDPVKKKLAVDTGWAPASYLRPGQTIASAPAVMNDWVVFQTNAVPTKTPMSVVAIAQSDAKKVVRIDPIPLRPGQESYASAAPAVDPQTNMVYAADAGTGTLTGISLQKDAMRKVWGASQRTMAGIALVGPKDRRVLVGTAVRPNANAQQLRNLTYTEQVVWRAAGNGKELARSDLLDPTGQRVVTPGWGGVMYGLGAKGRIYALQVAGPPSASLVVPTPPASAVPRPAGSAAPVPDGSAKPDPEATSASDSEGPSTPEPGASAVVTPAATEAPSPAESPEEDDAQ